MSFSGIILFFLVYFDFHCLIPGTNLFLHLARNMDECELHSKPDIWKTLGLNG